MIVLAGWLVRPALQDYVAGMQTDDNRLLPPVSCSGCPLKSPAEKGGMDRAILVVRSSSGSSIGKYCLLASTKPDQTLQS
jgi:hypothetical protein